MLVIFRKFHQNRTTYFWIDRNLKKMRKNFEHQCRSKIPLRIEWKHSQRPKITLKHTFKESPASSLRKAGKSRISLYSGSTWREPVTFWVFLICMSWNYQQNLRDQSQPFSVSECRWPWTYLFNGINNHDVSSQSNTSWVGTSPT